MQILAKTKHKIKHVKSQSTRLALTRIIQSLYYEWISIGILFNEEFTINDMFKQLMKFKIYYI